MKLDWGDGTVEPFTRFILIIWNIRIRPLMTTYQIKLTQKNPWGVTNISKRVTLPNVSH